MKHTSSFHANYTRQQVKPSCQRKLLQAQSLAESKISDWVIRQYLLHKQLQSYIAMMRLRAVSICRGMQSARSYFLNLRPTSSRKQKQYRGEPSLEQA